VVVRATNAFEQREAAEPGGQVPAHTPAERHSTLDPIELVVVRSVGIELARMLVEPDHAVGIPLRSPDHTNRNLPPRSFLQEPHRTCFRSGSDPDHKDPVALPVRYYYSRSSQVELRALGLMPRGTAGRESEAGSQPSHHWT